MEYKSKGVVGIIVTMLLLLVCVGTFIYIQSWFVQYKSELGTKVRTGNFKEDFEIQKIEGTYIYFKNDFRDNITIRSVKIGGKECFAKNLEIDEGFGRFDIGGCTMSLDNSEVYDVMVLTDEGVKSEADMIRNPVTNSLIITEEFGECDFASGYIRLFGMSGTQNAHADIDGSYTYSICARHLDYTLSMSSTGSYVTLFYLTQTNNSAVWTDQSSIYETPSTWHDVSISSSGGTLDYAINSSDMSNQDYVCVGAINEDNVYGSHIGDCDSSMTDKIWIRLI